MINKNKDVLASLKVEYTVLYYLSMFWFQGATLKFKSIKHISQSVNIEITDLTKLSGI